MYVYVLIYGNVVKKKKKIELKVSIRFPVWVLFNCISSYLHFVEFRILGKKKKNTTEVFAECHM